MVLESDLHQAGREPGILVGIPRCRYQLVLSACHGRDDIGIGTYQASREPDILEGIPRCRYQLALSKPNSSPQWGRHTHKAGCHQTGRVIPSNRVGKPR